MLTSPSLTYTPQRVASLYRSADLASKVMALERVELISDASGLLARVVNTSVSRYDPISRWVRYREGYSPELVRTILDRFPMDPDGYVFDPMCGSGSTQVAAQRLGYASAGTDVNPYAVLISRVKTSPLRHAQRRLIPEAIRGLRGRAPTHNTPLNDRDAYLTRYFPVANLCVLIAIRSWISRTFEDEPKAADFLRVALLSVVEACSNRKKDGNGLATRPSKVSDPLTAFTSLVSTMLDDISALENEPPVSATYQLSALDFDSTVSVVGRALKRDLGAIIFSPPYLNSFDYFESYKLELLFGGFYDRQELQAARSNLIRSYRQGGVLGAASEHELVELLVGEIRSRIPEKEHQTGVVDGRSRLLPNLIRGYFEDMSLFLQKAARVMPAGSMLHIVVDQSAYLGVPIPTDLLLADLGERHGLNLDSVLICRPAKTSAQQLKMQPELRQVLRESVVSLRK